MAKSFKKSGRGIISITDANRVPRIYMALSDKGAGFEVQDEKGMSRAAIGERGGRTVFSVVDKDRAPLVKTEKR